MGSTPLQKGGGGGAHGYRLSKNSSNKKIFKESKQIYQEALKESRYDHQLIYQKSINSKIEETKQRKRKTIWFNLPYSKNV